MKFYFRANNISVSMPEVDVAGRLVLVWKRGPRRTQTEPFEVKEKLSSIDGSLWRSASTTQDLALICTMFKNVKSGAFDSKLAAFTLKEEDEKGVETKLGTAQIDLSSFATSELTHDKVELAFMDGNIRLHLTLTSKLIKSLNVGDADSLDDASSVGSCAESERVPSDDESTPSLDSKFPPTPPASISDAPAVAAPAAAGGGGGGGSGGGRAEQSYAEELVDQRWAEQAGVERGLEEAEALRAELAEARELLGQSQKECKALRSRVQTLSSENRVLRREQRGGQRDEVLLQLETELVAKETERADMEENLARAFGGALDEAHARIASLTSERDRLLISLEEAKGSKGGFHLRK